MPLLELIPVRFSGVTLSGIAVLIPILFAAAFAAAGAIAFAELRKRKKTPPSSPLNSGSDGENSVTSTF